MEIVIGLMLMFLIGWLAIKSLKIVFWIVLVLIIANVLSSILGIVATVIIVGILLLKHKVITDGLIVFFCLAFLLGLVF